MEYEFLKEGFYVHVVDIPQYKMDYYQVLATEPSFYRSGDGATAEFAAVSSGSTSGYKNFPLLEPEDKPLHFAEYLWGVKDGCKYKIKIPTGTDRYGLDQDKDVGFITNLISPWYDPDPITALFLVPNYYPAIDADNITPTSLTPRVWFKGKKYAVKQVVDQNIITAITLKRLPCREVTVGGVDTAE